MRSTRKRWWALALVLLAAGSCLLLWRTISPARTGGPRSRIGQKKSRPEYNLVNGLQYDFVSGLQVETESLSRRERADLFEKRIDKHLAAEPLRSCIVAWVWANEHPEEFDSYFVPSIRALAAWYSTPDSKAAEPNDYVFWLIQCLARNPGVVRPCVALLGAKDAATRDVAQRILVKAWKHEDIIRQELIERVSVSNDVPPEGARRLLDYRVQQFLKDLSAKPTPIQLRCLDWFSRTGAMDANALRNVKYLDGFLKRDDPQIVRAAEMAALRGAYSARRAGARDKGPDGDISGTTAWPWPEGYSPPGEEGKPGAEGGALCFQVVKDTKDVSAEVGREWMRELSGIYMKSQPDLSCVAMRELLRKYDRALEDNRLALAALESWYHSEIRHDYEADDIGWSLIAQLDNSDDGIQEAVAQLDGDFPTGATETLRYAFQDMPKKICGLLADKIISGNKVSPKQAQRILQQRWDSWQSFLEVLGKRKQKDQLVLLRWLADSGTMSASVETNRRSIEQWTNVDKSESGRMAVRGAAVAGRARLEQGATVE